jgi:hypothetical protein
MEMYANAARSAFVSTIKRPHGAYLIRVLSATGLSLLLSLAFISQAMGAGTSGATFLTMGSGARIEALAGAGTALASGYDAAYWNPASLGRCEDNALSFSHAAWFADIGYEHMCYVYPLPQAMTLGISTSILHAQGIPRTSEDTYGLFNGTDGSFSYTAMAVSGSLGKYVGQGLYVGGSAKILYEDNEAEASAGMAFDMAGLYVSPNGRWSAGVASRNIGRGLRVHGVDQPLPSELSLGLATALVDSTLIASFDACGTADAGTRFSWGMEQRMGQMLFVRAGYTSSTERTAHKGLTVGVGISMKRLSLDYSASDFESLGLVHRFTLSIGGN